MILSCFRRGTLEYNTQILSNNHVFFSFWKKQFGPLHFNLIYKQLSLRLSFWYYTKYKYMEIALNNKNSRFSYPECIECYKSGLSGFPLKLCHFRRDEKDHLCILGKQRKNRIRVSGHQPMSSVCHLHNGPCFDYFTAWDPKGTNFGCWNLSGNKWFEWQSSSWYRGGIGEE